MSKKLLILAVLSLACLSFAYAAVENIKVSGDITATGVMRDLSLGDSRKDGSTIDAESFLLSQVRLRFDADLTENVSAVVRLINERLWGIEEDVESSNSKVDLDLAYVELKEMVYQPLTVVVGRQPLHYGTGLIIGDPDTNQVVSAGLTGIADDLSLRKSFDAVKAILDFSPWTLDLVFAQISEGYTNVDDDVILYGGNLAYKWNSYNGLTEAYFWVFDNNRNIGYNYVTTQVSENQAKTYVAGARFQLDPTEQLTLGVEGAYQFGDVVVGSNAFKRLRAFAGQAMAEYRFNTQYNPKLGLRYSYLSGNDDSDSKTYKGWDPVAENQSSGEILNILFPNSNAQTVMAYGSIMPREDVTLMLSYTWAKLAQKLDDSPYSPWAGPAYGNKYSINRNESYLGSEIDASILYDYTEDVQIKLTGAWFIPGDFFASQNDDTAYSLKAGLTVNF